MRLASRMTDCNSLWRKDKDYGTDIRESKRDQQHDGDRGSSDHPLAERVLRDGRDGASLRRGRGALHDYDYEKFPEEHLQHTEKELLSQGVDPEDVRAILSHGWGICTDVEPLTDMEKSLFTVDELTGIIQAAARMRPNGITDLNTKSFMKKFKDKKFAAKCDRELIKKGCELLGMEVRDVAEICIDGMRPHAEEIGLQGTEN